MEKIYSKPAITDHLEIDQYMWAILNTLGSSDTEDVTIDSAANWKAVRPINTSGIKVSYTYASYFFGHSNFIICISFSQLYSKKMISIPNDSIK